MKFIYFSAFFSWQARRTSHRRRVWGSVRDVPSMNQCRNRTFAVYSRWVRAGILFRDVPGDPEAAVEPDDQIWHKRARYGQEPAPFSRILHKLLTV